MQQPMARMPQNDPKLEALRQSGTLNPRPGDVTDELFASHSFFDARDLVQVKYEMLRRVQIEGRSITDSATAFGFSRPAFYQAQSALGEDGLAGLVPHKRGPKRAHKLTEDVLTFIHEARRSDPAVRYGELARLIHQRFGMTVHPRSIERGLLRHQKKRH
jgi:transposase